MHCRRRSLSVSVLSIIHSLPIPKSPARGHADLCGLRESTETTCTQNCPVWPNSCRPITPHCPVGAPWIPHSCHHIPKTASSVQLGLAPVLCVPQSSPRPQLSRHRVIDKAPPDPLSPTPCAAYGSHRRPSLSCRSVNNHHFASCPALFLESEHLRITAAARCLLGSINCLPSTLRAVALLWEVALDCVPSSFEHSTTTVATQPRHRARKDGKWRPHS